MLNDFEILSAYIIVYGKVQKVKKFSVNLNLDVGMHVLPRKSCSVRPGQRVYPTISLTLVNNLTSAIGR